MDYLKKDYIYHGKAEDLIKRIEPNSIAIKSRLVCKFLSYQ
jgi:hypothetical protein